MRGAPPGGGIIGGLGGNCGGTLNEGGAPPKGGPVNIGGALPGNILQSVSPRDEDMGGGTPMCGGIILVMGIVDVGGGPDIIMGGTAVLIGGMFLNLTVLSTFKDNNGSTLLGP